MEEKRKRFRVAIIGSRSIRSVDLSAYIPAEATQLISGGATGVDTLVEAYAHAHGIPIQVIRPDYALYGRKAPLVRNRQIVECADLVVAIWDGRSTGTTYTVDYANARGVPVRLFIPPAGPKKE